MKIVKSLIYILPPITFYKEITMKPIFSILSIFLVFCAFVTASPATDYSFVREFGTAGVESNRFNSIDGIAVDRFENVFVSDTYLLEPGYTGEFQVVKKWTTVGNYQLMWINNEGLEGPARGIDCSCDGDPFYVAPKDMAASHAFIGAHI